MVTSMPTLAQQIAEVYSFDDIASIQAVIDTFGDTEFAVDDLIERLHPLMAPTMPLSLFHAEIGLLMGWHW